MARRTRLSSRRSRQRIRPLGDHRGQAARARTGWQRGCRPPSARGPSSGTVVTVNPDAVRSARGSPQERSQHDRPAPGRFRRVHPGDRLPCSRSWPFFDPVREQASNLGDTQHAQVRQAGSRIDVTQVGPAVELRAACKRRPQRPGYRQCRRWSSAGRRAAGLPVPVQRSPPQRPQCPYGASSPGSR